MTQNPSGWYQAISNGNVLEFIYRGDDPRIVPRGSDWWDKAPTQNDYPDFKVIVTVWQEPAKVKDWEG